MDFFEDNFEKLARSMEAMMKGITGPSYFRSAGRDLWDPHVNIYEMEDRVVVCVELAGMAPGDLDVQVQGGILHVRGQRHKPVVPEAQGPIGVHLMEIDSGTFHRQLPMPVELDFSASKANYKNGYLWITLPKRPDEAADQQ